MRRDLIRDKYGDKLTIATRDFAVIAGAWTSAVALIFTLAVFIRVA